MKFAATEIRTRIVTADFALVMYDNGEGMMPYSKPVRGMRILARSCAENLREIFIILVALQQVPMFIGDSAKIDRESVDLANEKIKRDA